MVLEILHFLLKKEFDLDSIIGVDYAQTSVNYANTVANNFEIQDLSYLKGDASNLLFRDNEFDFVTARLALQIFNKPKEIIKELLRIVNPDGRIYLTNEVYSKMFAFPHTKEVTETYQDVTELYKELHMDLEYGLKMYRDLQELNCQDIKIESMMVSTAGIGGTDSQPLTKEL